MCVYCAVVLLAWTTPSVSISVTASARVSSSFPHPSLAIPSPTITTTTHQPLQLPPSFLSPTSFLVKIRVCNSGETDFYEIELPSLTYKCLLKSCAEELEVDVALIYKIRKLPNILLRRDRDVQRLKEGQELEVVIREAPAMSMNPLSLSGGYGSSSNGLSIMNLPLQGDPSSLTISPSLGLHPTSHVNGLHWGQTYFSYTWHMHIDHTKSTLCIYIYIYIIHTYIYIYVVGMGGTLSTCIFKPSQILHVGVVGGGGGGGESSGPTIMVVARQLCRISWPAYNHFFHVAKSSASIGYVTSIGCTYFQEVELGAKTSS